jgi:hypothetical protein
MKIKDNLSDDALTLCGQIEILLEKNMKLLKEMSDAGAFKDKKYEEYSEEAKELLKENSYLTALSLIGQYANIHVQEDRSLTAYHKSLVEPAVELKPNGKESACIKLWSGVPEYQEKFEMDHEVL